MTTFKYPKIERDESVKDDLHGKTVADPYRWLEDPHSDKTKKFVRDQNEVTEEYLNRCAYREKIKSQLKLNQDYPKIGCTFKRGGKYYFFKNSGLQNQSVLYQQSSLDGEETVFFDPNLLSEDGTVSLAHTAFSRDGKWMAYGLSYSGSDWIEINVKDLTTNKDLPEKLTRVKFTSIEWTHDNKGFFYAQYPHHKGEVVGNAIDSNEKHQVFYHVLNTDQSQDVLKVSFDEHPKWIVGVTVSDDGKHLHIFPRDGCQDNQWFYASLENITSSEKLKLSTIYDKFEADFDYISNNGDTVYFRTNLNAPNYKVAKLSLKNPSIENWVDVIPNHPDDVLDSAEIFTVNGKDYVLVNFMRKVVYYLELHELEGKLVKEIKTPPGTITKYPGRRYDGEFFFHFMSFLSPGKAYQFNLADLSSEPKLLRESKPKNFSADEYVIKQIFYESSDKVKVPMFIVHKKDLILNGKNPCVLYGYGGFNIQVTSTFSINRLVWLKNLDGVFAVANIRGGGENGQAWHDSGRLLNKQQCFNDFITAAEYLVKENYTQTSRLAIEGGSNGGLLVAAVSNQRPDLFGATICHVGVLDMLRYQKFTIGHAWISEYGDPEDKTHFENLITYSPYHNVPENISHYPATFVLTAEFDDRVVASHSLKYVSQLQSKLANKLPETPLLLRVDTKAGHGGGRSLSKQIDESSDIYCFLYNSLNLVDYYKAD